MLRTNGFVVADTTAKVHAERQLRACEHAMLGAWEGLADER
jgi:hypothetical protein